MFTELQRVCVCDVLLIFEERGLDRSESSFSAQGPSQEDLARQVIVRIVTRKILLDASKNGATLAATRHTVAGAFLSDDQKHGSRKLCFGWPIASKCGYVFRHDLPGFEC
jgi:hypothetical protein